MRWAVASCPQAQFTLFVDDDYYVSTKNLLRFIRHPNNYPQGALLEEKETVKAREAMRNAALKKTGQRELASVADSNVELDYVKESLKWFSESDLKNDKGFYVGFLFGSSVPKRSSLSKWFVTLDEYPFFRFPPYITAGAILLDRSTLLRLYAGTLYTKLFRFDDPFLGIVAMKVGVRPTHSDYFVFDPSSMYNALYGPAFEYVVASHGFRDADRMRRTWEGAKSAGHA
jgi:hypothetical protein